MICDLVQTSPNARRAQAIARTLGYYRAARFLAKRGFSLVDAKRALRLPARIGDFRPSWDARPGGIDILPERVI